MPSGAVRVTTWVVRRSLALSIMLALAAAPAFAEDGAAPRTSQSPADATAPAADASVADASTPEPSRFDGRYQIVEREVAEAAARAAIADAVRGLNPGIRQVFATELARVLDVRRNVAIDTVSAAENVRITLDGQSITAPRTGAPRAQTGTSGRRETFVHRFLGDALIQESRTPNGVRTSAFTFDASGMLVITTRFSTPLLPRQIETVARYRRAAP